ncbi:MAG TPA: MFS transporter [Gemmatimonadales bacterium]|nr:MFS transporter [Gemmatimonadales bacterium]
MTAAPAGDTDPRRWRMLALLAAAELLGMCMWFAATAVAPELRARWGLTAGQSAWLTSVVQLGFVAGTLLAAALNLADVVAARTLFAASATAGAVANLLLLATARYPVALLLRFLTGLCLAGVYPPAMKMAATWFRSGRGLAIGVVVGALTVGKALPYLVEAVGGVRVAPVVVVTSAAALAAALLVWLGYADGPFAFPRRPFTPRLVVEVARERPVRLATLGYLGHMWELYALWAWIGAFLGASAAARAARGLPAPGAHTIHLLTFATIAIGAVGCIWGGRLADRLGRERLVIGSLAASGICAVLSAAAFGQSFWVLVPLVWVWGVAVIADSAQFSALVTETAPPHAVGTALTLQTSLGFLLTMVTIQMVPPIVAALGWRFAFPALALGPACGITAIRRLDRLRRTGGGHGRTTVVASGGRSRTSTPRGLDA